MTKPMHPHEHRLVLTHLPPLPQPCVDGGGARIARTLYAGLGSAGQRWYRLDLDHAGASWERCADFPGPAPHCAVVVAAGQAVHVFGGFGKATADGTTAQFDTGYRYLPASDRWELLRTVLPLGLTGACALALDASTLLFFGGYHREQFDTFHREMETAPDNDRGAINARYMQRPIAQFDWNRAPWSLNLPTMTWHCLASQPHPGHCKATLIADGEHFYLLGGEVKPGLRDHTIKHGRLQGGSVRWEAALPVPLEDGFVEHPFFHALLAGMVRIFDGESGARCEWNIRLHPYRIVTNELEQGKPTPEGRHRDGVDFIIMMLVRRAGVSGGVTRVSDREDRTLIEVMLSQGLDIIVADDRQVFHEVTPIDCAKEGEEGYRDALIVAFTRKDKPA